jgi:hypothetical protein
VYWGSLSLSKLAAGFLPRMEEVSVDGRVLGFACLLSLVSGLMFGLVPAVRSMKVDLNECLKESTAVRSCSGSHRPLTRRLLVVTEIALSLVLLIGAGLSLKSFVLLNRVRLGFNPKNVLVVKVAGLDALDPPAGPELMAVPVRQVVQATLGEDSAVWFETMEDRLAGSIVPQRFQTALVALFSAVGLVLAAIGIYCVISYSVAQRIREFGVRIAVGAQRADILQLVVRQALWLVAVGLVLGLLGAVVLTRVLRTFLFEVEPLDPLTFLCVSAFLAVVALLASYVPAGRAARIDPMAALRYE